MNITYIILQFLISGSVVVGATILATYIDSKWAGLLVALPIMTVLGFIFISLHNDAVTTQRYLISALIFMIPAAIYIASILLLHYRFSILVSLFLSLIPFGIAIYFIQRII